MARTHAALFLVITVFTATQTAWTSASSEPFTRPNAQEGSADSAGSGNSVYPSLSVGYGGMKSKQGISWGIGIWYHPDPLIFGLLYSGGSQVNTEFVNVWGGPEAPRRVDNIHTVSLLAGFRPFAGTPVLELDGGLGWYTETRWLGQWDNIESSGMGAMLIAKFLFAGAFARPGFSASYFAGFGGSHILSISFTIEVGGR